MTIIGFLQNCVQLVMCCEELSKYRQSWPCYTSLTQTRYAHLEDWVTWGSLHYMYFIHKSEGGDSFHIPNSESVRAYECKLAFNVPLDNYVMEVAHWLKVISELIESATISLEGQDAEDWVTFASYIFRTENIVHSGGISVLQHTIR